ncbi:Lipid A core - O-antigen ligase and related enzymes [Legionella lansingensis]|uniref:O-antigen biosynthesis protein n=1 Tax=Legionella lansingensis TaxID=45067 RepID=A0A0W0VWL5_9GAMM|nr:O-antigen ligase family protein [Legionella lansingensis]KTD24333.1 hypothetical protein Llan_0472 [Legionella lansingensis]SNV51762.1 Lipid A core - O-antigen ligase and related enzymes [Legionella lansingensis]
MSNYSSETVQPARTANSWNSFGLYTLFLLLFLQPFHYLLFDTFIYYRELFAVVFSVLCCMKLSDLFYKRHPSELFLLIFFPMLLALFAIVDPGTNLYGNDATGASLHLKTINSDLYILRNALIYVPMVVYFALRGLSEKEVQKIAFIAVVVAPLSVLEYLNVHQIYTLSAFGAIIENGGGAIEYNTYVPYLTFPVLSAIYLLSSRIKNSRKLIVLISLLFLSIYILLSSSRQSILFILFCVGVFTVWEKENGLVKKILFLAVCFLSVFLVFNLVSKNIVLEHDTRVKYENRLTSIGLTIIDRHSWKHHSLKERSEVNTAEKAVLDLRWNPVQFNRNLSEPLSWIMPLSLPLWIQSTSEVQPVQIGQGEEDIVTLNNKLLHKYTGTSAPPGAGRWEIIKDGLTRLKSSEYLIGVGLTAVINSGPHNDYVRWLQRIGIFAMIIGFAPFLIAASRSYQSKYRTERNGFMLYLFLSVMFTLYHSLFGYPREDAYQALYCFLGLAMWLGAKKNFIFSLETRSNHGWRFSFMNMPERAVLTGK